MSSMLGMNRLNVSMFGEKTQVPNNIFAKLMYYLHCVTVVIDYERDNILTDYKNYNDLTDEQIEAVYNLALLLNPKIFISAGIFIVDSKLLPDDVDNQFYKITDERIGVHINQNFMVGGKIVKVLNVMACNDSWLTRFYYLPLQEIKTILIGIISRMQNYPKINTDSSFDLNNQTIINAPPVPIIFKEFKTEPVSITCQYCRNLITTRTKPKLNLLACCCFLFFCPLYCCFKLCDDKSFCCLDYSHSCPICGRVVGQYEAC